MIKKLISPLVMAILVFTLLNPISIAQSESNEFAQVFVLLNPVASDTQQLAQLHDFINVSGGRTVHTFPPQALIAKVPATILPQFSTMPSIAVVFTEAVELSTIDAYGPEARRWATVWNNIITPKSEISESASITDEHSMDDQPHAFVAPDLPAGNELRIAGASAVTPGYYQTSEYLAGSIAVGIVLVESNGSMDPSTEDWTADEKQQVFTEIVEALDWWAELEPRANLSFVYEDHFSSPLPTAVEPITRSYADQQYWIADAMAALGYNASSYFTRVRDYTNDLRATYQTDWAFTIFVVDSSADNDNRFSDGFFAYAYLGGPFLVMTSGNNGYGPAYMDAVATHEIGHVFHAQDQYASAQTPCTQRSGYLYIENQNSRYGGCLMNETSIMRGQILPFQVSAIDPYAAGQIGWRDSDGDNIFDPMDTEISITIDNISQNDNGITGAGAAEIIPYPSPSRPSVAINTLTGVQYRFDQEDWQPAQAVDGVFNGTSESYSFTANSLAPGIHILEIGALDSAGNTSAMFAPETIYIFDPVDGGLNTELELLDEIVMKGMPATMPGVAYDMAGSLVTNVEYRINDNSWQPAQPQDGAFDSDYESFTLGIDPQQLGSGTFRIDARATKADGYVEINFASQEIKIVDKSLQTIFIPAIIRNSQ